MADEGQIRAAVESVGLGEDAGADTSSLDQASLFRAVQEGNVQAIKALIHHRQGINLNAYNDTGVTPLILAVYKYETHRSTAVVDTLLKNGADVSVKAAPTPAHHKMSIVRHDLKGPDGAPAETKRVVFDHKTALLIALELKSALYLKGWEYRHWDSLLYILSEATVKQLTGIIQESTVFANAVSDTVQKNWEAVFASGKHETVELHAEGKDIVALKLLVTGASKVLKLNLEHNSRLEIKDASYNIAKAMVHFLYAGKVDTQFINQRGIDLFITAHKYGVESLKHLCEATVVAHPDNWIKLLTAAIESDSQILALKTAKSIQDLMVKRQSSQIPLQRGFSDIQDAPEQLFQRPL